MARIAFILLCHKDAAAVIAQAERLIAGGAYVAIHFDARSPADQYKAITDALADRPEVVFPDTRLRCGWGEWSLVDATLRTVRSALSAFPDATHFYMLSGDCAAIKSSAYADRMLSAGDRDFIECHDFFTSDWIKTGLKRDRLVYRHWFNERTQKWWFYTALQLQKRFRLERAIPDDLQIMVGSQWWCLRRTTLDAILEFVATRPDVPRFFSTTWIPDETFFQTMVAHVVPSAEIETRSLTFKLFSDYGMPVTFYNDHYDLLLTQEHLFARKISGDATLLKERLGALWDSARTDFTVSGDGKKLYEFLTGRGRIGQRFAPRFWEREATLGRDRQLIMIVCKKWHVAKRLLRAVTAEPGISGVAYLFDEADSNLPSLGGIERNLDKRNRHRRALIRMLFEYFNDGKLVICLDPSNLELMRDLTSDRADATILEVECQIDDAYLLGHAERIGLAARDSPPELIARLLPTLRSEFAFESERIRETRFAPHHLLRQSASLQSNATLLSEAFRVAPEIGARLAATPYLFDD